MWQLENRKRDNFDSEIELQLCTYTSQYLESIKIKKSNNVKSNRTNVPMLFDGFFPFKLLLMFLMITF